MSKITRGVLAKKPKAKAKAAAPAAEKPTKEQIAQAKGKLENIAKEANARFQIAEKEKLRSEDHCLAAAIILKDAKSLCVVTGQNFKAWCEKNITQSYSTARRYLGIAEKPDPQKALADYRADAAKRNREARKRAKERQAGNRPAQTGSGAQVSAAPRQRQATGVDALKLAFLDLPLADQVAFARWVAGETGYELVDKLSAAAPQPVASTGPVGVAAEDGSDIPAHLKSPKVRRRTAPAAEAAAS